MDADVRAAHRTGLLDRVFHGSRVGMLVARFDDGAVLEANDTFAGLIGRPLVQVLAANVVDLDAIVVIRASDVDGRATARSRYAELRETEVRYRAMVEQMPAITYTQVEDPATTTG